MEREHTINGVVGRLFVVEKEGLFTCQKWAAVRVVPGTSNEQLKVIIRFDDQCKNGFQTFSITADYYRVKGTLDVNIASGCLHEDIARIYPELAPLIKWHLCSTDGPTHYPANVVYLAGDRDYEGLRAGEQRQKKTNRGTPMWELRATMEDGVLLNTDDAAEGTVPLYRLKTLKVSVERPSVAPHLEWAPYMTTGKGKKRELDAARRAAVWLDAPDEVLSLPPAELRVVLEERLPRLIEEFKKDMLACGFEWRVKE